MTKIEIDTDIYKAHSTRAASSSVAKSTGVPITTIMDSVGLGICSDLCKM